MEGSAAPDSTEKAQESPRLSPSLPPRTSFRRNDAGSRMGTTTVRSLGNGEAEVKREDGGEFWVVGVEWGWPVSDLARGAENLCRCPWNKIIRHGDSG